MSCLNPWWPPLVPGWYLLCLHLPHPSKGVDLATFLKGVDLATFLAPKLWTWEVPETVCRHLQHELVVKGQPRTWPHRPRQDEALWSLEQTADYRNFKQHRKTALVWLSKEGQKDDQIRSLRMFHAAGGKGKEAHRAAHRLNALQNQLHLGWALGRK